MELTVTVPPSTVRDLPAATTPSWRITEEDAVVSGTTNLVWSGADVDVNDTLTYDVYFGTTNPPTSAVATDLTAENFDVTTQAATTYYWQVDTKDDTGTKTIGAVWTFTTN